MHTKAWGLSSHPHAPEGPESDELQEYEVSD